MKHNINQILKSIVKFNLPNDYPDELVENHIQMIKDNFEISKNKIKSILKIKQ